MANQIRGRFQKDADKTALDYSSSIHYDWRLYPYDIAGSMAHAKMLAKQGIITMAEGKAIVEGLAEIGEEISEGKFQFKPELEDIHMNIEARLVEKLGDTGKKLHTARSRNDQVALDVRLFTRDAIIHTIGDIIELQSTLVELASAHKVTIIPGYTHLQKAQPILLAHHFLAYFEMLGRDIERLDNCLTRVDVMPLGSGALAGVAYDIDRKFVAEELGFKQISRNSLDAVADRDFIIEFEADASLCMMHLSRLAEELVLWSSGEFDFIEIDDAYTTGSSIMPQKKNPDMAELVRGKTGRVYGALMNLLTTMKGLPLAYNRDMQEDKQPMFDVVKTARESLYILAHVLVHTTFDKYHLEEELRTDFLTATDMADYLVTKGIPFREAHTITGEIVQYCVTHKMYFGNLDLGTLREFSPKFEPDIFDFILPQTSVERKQSAGSTSPQEVKKQIVHWTRVLSKRRV